jgi:acyl carrier protein
VKGQLRQFIIDSFAFGLEDTPFSDSDSLIGKGLIDSTGVLELVSFIEQTFSIKVEDRELIPENLDSIDKLSRFLEVKLQEAGAPVAS